MTRTGRPRGVAGPGRRELGKLVHELVTRNSASQTDFAKSAGISYHALYRLVDPDHGSDSVVGWSVIEKVERALPVPTGLFRLVDELDFDGALALDYPDRRNARIVAELLASTHVAEKVTYGPSGIADS